MVAQQQVLRYKGQTLELLDQVDFTGSVCVWLSWRHVSYFSLSTPVPQLSMDPSGFSWQQVPVIGSCDLVCTSSEGVAGTESPPTMKVTICLFTCVHVVVCVLFIHIVYLLLLTITPSGVVGSGRSFYQYCDFGYHGHWN